jgi:hypothetical protein
MSQLQVTGEAKIRDIQGPVVANDGVITALDGAASQYVRGDGTLADFPTSSGGGSSVSYYLNSSVSQGTIGGVAYRELSKEPIIGAGTDIAISANGYVASYLTDANDPDVLSIPGGNFNCEFYFSVNNNTGNPFFYAELYKYDGTTFTLLGSSVGVPEYINQGTIIAPYYFAIPVPTSALALTDRLAIRIYVNVDGRTVTLHTENGHLCQVVTTLSKGMVSLNNLTDQSQFLTTGTSGTNFAIVSSGDTHTFNLPIASATNTGKLSSTDWSTFNNKQAALTFTAPLDNTSNTISIAAASASVDGYLDNLDWTKFNTAYNDSIISAAVTGTTTKTLTLNQQDGGTITASWTDDNTDAVTSVFGRTGAVVAVSGDYNTSQVTELTNLYFTDARSRAALSFTAGSGAYNSTTGVITIPTNNNQITNGSNFITLGSLSAGTGISYNNTTGVIASTITQYTDALARAAISLTTTGTSGAATYNSTTGVLNIPNYAPDLSGYVTLGTAQTITSAKTFTARITQNTDDNYLVLNRSAVNKFFGVLYQTAGTNQWFVGLRELNTNHYYIYNEVLGTNAVTINIANNNATFGATISATNFSGSSSGTNTGDQTLAGLGGVGGTGTINTVPKFTAASTIASSNIYVNGNFVGINQSSPSTYALDIHSANSSFNLRLFQPLTATDTYNSMFITGNMTTVAAYFGIGGATTGNPSFRDVAVIGTQSSHPLVFNTSDTNQMRLFANGNLLLGTGTTDAGFKLDVNGTGRFGGALSGTSATFSGNVTSNGTFVAASTGGNIQLKGSTDGFLGVNNSNTLFLTDWATAAKGLQINLSTGAATFSSSVTAVGNVNTSNSFVSNIINGYGLVLNRSAVTTYNGISLQTAGVAQWFVGMRENLSSNNYIIYNENGTDALTISKSNSNVLINTPSGISGGGALQVNGNVNINGVFQINGTTIGGGGGSGVTGSGTTNFIPKWSGGTSLSNSAMLEEAGGIQYFGGSSSGGNPTATPKFFRFNNDYSSGYTDASLKIYLFNEGGTRQGFTSGPAYDIQYHSSGSASGRHAFYVGNTEIIRFNQTNVLINRITSAGYTFDVNGTGRFTGQLTGTDALFAGSVTASSGFFDTSDRRLKIIVKDYEQPKGIENVKSRMYVKNGKKELGYFAQDLQEILPSAVGQGDDGFLTLSYSQVHTAKIAYLEEKVAQLENLIKSLL